VEYDGGEEVAGLDENGREHAPEHQQRKERLRLSMRKGRNV